MNPQSWNRYAYVLNDPITYNDPAGLIALCPEGTRTGPDGRSCVPDDPLFLGDVVKIRNRIRIPFTRKFLFQRGGAGAGPRNPPPDVKIGSGVVAHKVVNAGFRWTKVKEAFDTLLERLQDDSECRKWLASGERPAKVGDPELLKDTKLGLAGRFSKDNSPAPGIAAVAPEGAEWDIIINGEGHFFYGGDNPRYSHGDFR